MAEPGLDTGGAGAWFLRSTRQQVPCHHGSRGISGEELCCGSATALSSSLGGSLCCSQAGEAKFGTTPSKCSVTGLWGMQHPSTKGLVKKQCFTGSPLLGQRVCSLLARCHAWWRLWWMVSSKWNETCFCCGCACTPLHPIWSLPVSLISFRFPFCSIMLVLFPQPNQEASNFDVPWRSFLQPSSPLHPRDNYTQVGAASLQQIG